MIEQRNGFLRQNPRMEGKKRSKVEYPVSIFNASDGGFTPKYCHCVNGQQTLEYSPLFLKKIKDYNHASLSF